MTAKVTAAGGIAKLFALAFGAEGGDATPVSSSNPLPTGAPAGGALTKSIVVLTGGSDALVPAGSGTRSIWIRNPTGNDSIALGLAGEVAAIATGWPVPGGGSIIKEPGLSNAVTVIGTAGQSVLVYYG